MFDPSQISMLMMFPMSLVASVMQNGGNATHNEHDFHALSQRREAITNQTTSDDHSVSNQHL